MEAKNSLNKFNERVYSAEESIELLYNGINIDGIILEKSEQSLYNENAPVILDVPYEFKQTDESLSILEFHKNNTIKWNIPDKYKSINIKTHILSKCKTTEEINRVESELVLYEKYNLLMILRVFVYLVDIMKKNNIVWGVGRGSSVSSYCLYLIGIHKINSIKYDLDIREFLR